MAEPNSVKVFNLDEANAVLPCLEALLADFEEKQESFRRLQDEVFFEEILNDSSLSETRQKELEKALTRLAEEISKIRQLGCILRHTERGLVDFLARQGDGWIYYCWRRGEQQIQFYHSLKGGYLERKPLN